MAEYDARIGKELNILAYRNKTFPMNIIATVTSTGDVFDLTDYSFKMQLKKTFDDSPVVSMDISVTIGTGLIDISKAFGKMDIPAGEYVYDLETTYPDTTTQAWLWGKITITDKVT